MVTNTGLTWPSAPASPPSYINQGYTQGNPSNPSGLGSGDAAYGVTRNPTGAGEFTQGQMVYGGANAINQDPRSVARWASYQGQFIPTIWSDMMINLFYDQTHLTEMFNSKWEGEIRGKGDSVVIHRDVEADTFEHIMNQPLEIQTLGPDSQKLFIDKGRYFAIGMHDVSKVQSQYPLLQRFTSAGAKAMVRDVESEIYLQCFANTDPIHGKYGHGGGADDLYDLGTDAAPLSMSDPDQIMETILDMGGQLDENNMPGDATRFLCISPFVKRRIMSTEMWKANFSGDGTSMRRTGPDRQHRRAEHHHLDAASERVRGLRLDHGELEGRRRHSERLQALRNPDGGRQRQVPRDDGDGLQDGLHHGLAAGEDPGIRARVPVRGRLSAA